MSNETKFVEGLICKRSDNAPEWVVVNLSINVKQLTKFMSENENNGWVNVQVNRARSGKLYAKLDNFKPEGRQQGQQSAKPPQTAPQTQPEQAPQVYSDELIDDIPF